MGKVIVMLLLAIAAFFFILNDAPKQQAAKIEKNETQILKKEHKIMHEVRQLEDQMQDDVNRRMAPVN